MSDKPKKVMTPEMLEKLKVAREKALAVRQEKAKKMQEIKALERESKEKQLNDKLTELKSKVEVVHQAPSTKLKFGSNSENLSLPSAPIDIPPRPPPKKKEKKERVKKKLESLLEESSSDDSSDGDVSDEEDVVKRFLKDKYKHKYKHKYQSKVDHMLVKGHTANYLKHRVNEDMLKMAQQSLFS